jgi:hypothetical protein
MEEVEIKAVIKYLCKKRMSQKGIHEDLNDTSGNEYPSQSSVNKWDVEFKRSRESI